MSEATAFVLYWLLCATGMAALLFGSLGLYCWHGIEQERAEQRAIERWRRKQNASRPS